METFDQDRLVELIDEYNLFVSRCRLGDETFQHTVYFLLKKIAELEYSMKTIPGGDLKLKMKTIPGGDLKLKMKMIPGGE